MNGQLECSKSNKLNKKITIRINPN